VTFDGFGRKRRWWKRRWGKQALDHRCRPSHLPFPHFPFYSRGKRRPVWGWSLRFVPVGHAPQPIIRGQNTVHSKGFSVAAIPVNFGDTFLAGINDGTRAGIRVQDAWGSDSGSIGDLDQVALSELVRYKDKGVFKGVGHSNSGYIGPATAYTTDEHTLPLAIISAARSPSASTSSSVHPTPGAHRR
jgi:hypothetical protein